MIKSLLIIALVIGSTSILAACTQQNQTMDDTGTMETAPAGSNVDTNPDAANQEMTGPLEVTMDGGEFFFSPNVITASPGQEVIITLTNTQGEMPHDFVIDELDVASEEIEQGEETTVSFVVPETAAGQDYEFYCSVGEHRANGMVGVLTVLPE
jgi:plastocyanin